MAGHRPGQGDVDAREYTVVPGLIDIHCHGAIGEEFRVDCSEKTRGYLASRGTTGFLATTGMAVRRNFLDGMRRLHRRIAEKRPEHGAQILGIRCEGPFLEPSLGAQLAELCWEITDENLATVFEAAGENLVMLDVSPELPGANKLIKQAAARGIVVSAAHTQAGEDDMERAYEAGLSHMTHIFNGTKRPPSKGGVGTLGVGADEFALICDGMTAEVLSYLQQRLKSLELQS